MSVEHMFGIYRVTALAPAEVGAQEDADNHSEIESRRRGHGARCPC